MSNQLVQSKILTVKQAALRLNISEKTLRNWVYKGIVPSFRLNGLRRFHEDELDQWVRSQVRN